jgi:tetratricopeptide (TPR) repeat protein
MRKIIHLISLFLIIFPLFIFLLPTHSFAENSKLTATEWFDKAKVLYGENDGKYTDPREAIEYLNSAIKLQPDYARAYNARGIAYNNLGQYQQAIEDFNEAIRLQPNDSKAYVNRSYAYSKLSKHNLGCRDAQKACELRDCRLLNMAKGNGFCLFPVPSAGSSVKKRIESVRVLQKYFNDAINWDPIITLDGKDKTILIIESVHLTWMMVNAKFVEHDGMVQDLKDLGFKKVVFIKHRYNEKEMSGWEWDIEENTLN